MLLQLLKTRRSIRRYTEQPIEKSIVDRLVEAVLRSPSSRGINPWEFVVVNDRNLLGRLSESKPHGAGFLANAPLGIVVCADPQKSDVWVEDASIASLMIHLAAHSLDLGSCWIQLRNRMYDDTTSSTQYVVEQLRLPPHLEVEAIVAIGYPAEVKQPHTTESLPYEKVHLNAYGSGYPHEGQ